MRIARVLTILVLVAAGCADDSGETSTTATPITTTTVVATTTPPPTTAAPAVAFSPSGLEVASLGDDASEVIAAVAGALGPPTHDDILDSGQWQPHPLVPGAEFRSVVFGDALLLFFGSDATPVGAAGTRHFQDWYYHGLTAADGTVHPLGPPGLKTTEGIGVGDTVADLLAAYPDARLVEEPLAGSYRYQVHPAGTAYYLCFHFPGFDAPEATTPILAVGGSGVHDCTYGGE